MNYNPNELHNISFKKAVVGGYNEDAVNEVLDKVIEDYNNYIHEVIELKDKVSMLNEALQHYKTIEESLQNALVLAQQTGEDIKSNAYHKAENIVKEAENKAQQKVSEANDEVAKIKFEYEKTNKEICVYRAKVESLLMSQWEVLKQMNRESN